MVGVIALEVHAVGHTPQIGQVAQHRRHEEVQQEEQHAAAQGKGEGKQALEVGTGQGAHRLLPVQKVVHADLERPGQREEQRHVRIAPLALPAGDALVAHPKQICQLLLGEAPGPAVLTQPFTKGIHILISFLLAQG